MHASLLKALDVTKHVFLVDECQQYNWCVGE